MKCRTFTVRLWFICTTAPSACKARRAPPMGPTSRSCRDLHHTARRPAARLAAAGRLPILGRLGAPGAFLRVPQARPAKHQPDHYRRGEPGGQADQHPRPRAHPAPQADIPDTGRVPYPSHDQPCRSVTAERRYRAPLRSRARTGAGTAPAGSPARCAGASMKGEAAVGADAAAAPRWVGKETQPGGAPALGNAAVAGRTRSQLCPRTAPAVRYPGRARRCGRPPPLSASWVIRVVPRLVPGRPASRRRFAVHHHVPRPVLTRGERGGTVAWHPRDSDPARSPLVAVRAALRVTPPVRTLHPHDTIRT